MSQPAPALAPARPALAFTSVLDALLNDQYAHGAVAYGADGAPDLMASLVNAQPNSATGAIPARDSGAGRQFISYAGDGSTDAASLSGYSDDDIAADLIRQAGSNGELSLANVLQTLQIDARNPGGAAVAEGVSEAWARLSHGHGAISATELNARRPGRRCRGDSNAPAPAWRGRRRVPRRP